MSSDRSKEGPATRITVRRAAEGGYEVTVTQWRADEARMVVQDGDAAGAAAQAIKEYGLQGEMLVDLPAS